jgi:hypothetical protein
MMRGLHGSNPRKQLPLNTIFVFFVFMCFLLLRFLLPLLLLRRPLPILPLRLLLMFIICLFLPLASSFVVERPSAKRAAQPSMLSTMPLPAGTAKGTLHQWIKRPSAWPAAWPHKGNEADEGANSPTQNNPHSFESAQLCKHEFRNAQLCAELADLPTAVLSIRCLCHNSDNP